MHARLVVGDARKRGGGIWSLWPAPLLPISQHVRVGPPIHCFACCLELRTRPGFFSGSKRHGEVPASRESRSHRVCQGALAEHRPLARVRASWDVILARAARDPPQAQRRGVERVPEGPISRWEELNAGKAHATLARADATWRAGACGPAWPAPHPSTCLAPCGAARARELPLGHCSLPAAILKCQRQRSGHSVQGPSCALLESTMRRREARLCFLPREWCLTDGTTDVCK